MLIRSKKFTEIVETIHNLTIGTICPHIGPHAATRIKEHKKAIIYSSIYSSNLRYKELRNILFVENLLSLFVITHL